MASPTRKRTWLDYLFGPWILRLLGVDYPERPTLELIAGSNVTISATDDSVGEATQVTISANAGAGGLLPAADTEYNVLTIASSDGGNVWGSRAPINGHIVVETTSFQALHKDNPIHTEKQARFRGPTIEATSHGTPSFGESKSVWDSLQTTNATVTTLLTIDLHQEDGTTAYGDGIISLSVRVTAASPAGGTVIAHEVLLRRHSGTLTLVSEQDISISALQQIAVTVACIASGNDAIVVQVTGIAATTINWTGCALVQWVKE